MEDFGKEMFNQTEMAAGSQLAVTTKRERKKKRERQRDVVCGK